MRRRVRISAFLCSGDRFSWLCPTHRETAIKKEDEDARVMAFVAQHRAAIVLMMERRKKKEDDFFRGLLAKQQVDSMNAHRRQG